jgi:hypothetical protein
MICLYAKLKEDGDGARVVKYIKLSGERGAKLKRLMPVVIKLKRLKKGKFIKGRVIVSRET